MRYIAVCLSFFVHVLLVLLLFWPAIPVPDQPSSVIDLDLITLVKDGKPEHPDIPVKKTMQPKKMKNREAKPPPDRIKKTTTKPGYKKQIPKTQTVKAEPEGRPEKQVQGSIVQPDKSPDSVSSNAIVLKQGKGITVGNSTVVLKRGSESRSMDSIAGYDFDENDFRGHYETATGRQIVVIDARAEHGRLVLYDHKTGLTRKLKKAGYGDFIYTYGPSFGEDEPVEGSVVFLPGDEHWIHRFMWLPADGAAEYPVKARLDALKAVDSDREENLFIPVHKGRYPAVILVKDGMDIPAARFSEVARHLCRQGVVVEIIDGLSEEAVRKAAQRLTELGKVDPMRIGLWLRSYQAQKMPRIPEYAGRLGFVILTIDSPAGGLYPEWGASAVPDSVPIFIGFRNFGSDWKRVFSVLQTGFQSPPNQLTILDHIPQARKGPGKEVNWLDSLSGDFVSSISAWLDSQ